MKKEGSTLEEILSFEQQHVRFWRRFGHTGSEPDFEGLKVLEIGCGRGWRCLEAAGRKASRVVGIDPDEEALTYAQERLKHFPELTGVVTYEVGTIHDLAEEGFDVVISENAFEHILDVPAVLASIRRLLRPGGRAYIGFAPLYHSPFGDHGWMQEALPWGNRFAIPWSHLLVPQQWLFRRMEKLYGKPVQSTIDWPFLHLNRATAADFRAMFRESKLRVVVGVTNANESRKGRLLGLLSKVPVLDKYFTVGLYYVLEK